MLEMGGGHAVEEAAGAIQCCEQGRGHDHDVASHAGSLGWRLAWPCLACGLAFCGRVEHGLPEPGRLVLVAAVGGRRRLQWEGRGRHWHCQRPAAGSQRRGRQTPAPGRPLVGLLLAAGWAAWLLAGFLVGVESKAQSAHTRIFFCCCDV